MSDGALSQDEIDALLQGTDDSSFEMESEGLEVLEDGGALSQAEHKALHDLINNASSSVGDALGAMVETKISLSNPRIEVLGLDAVIAQLSGEIVEVRMDFEEGVQGEHAYVLTKDAAGILSGLMMGQNGNELTEAALSAVSEAMNIISGNASNKIGSSVGKALKPAAPECTIKTSEQLSLNSSGEFLKIAYDFEIEGQPSSTLVELYGMNIIHDFLAALLPESNKQAQAQGGQQMGGMNQQMNMGMNQQMGMGMNPQMNMGMNQQMNMGHNMMNPQMNMGMMPGFQQTPVRGVQFPDINAFSGEGHESNINLLMDVHMEMTVELGRTKKSIKDILGMGEGTVIELDKLAGEPVDVLVNGQLIAKGEVVVIDENFGVRVTEIINPLDRLREMS